jgi:hypothetical protein
MNEINLPHFDIDTEWLNEIFECKDPYGKMLRMTLELENQISILLSHLKIANSKQLKAMDFETKVLLIRALRIPKIFCDAVEKIRKIRNDFAHNKYKEFSSYKDTIKHLLKNTGISTPKNLTDFTVTRTKKGNTTEQKVSDMNLGDQLAVITILLASTIAAFFDGFNFPEPMPKRIVR